MNFKEVVLQIAQGKFKAFDANEARICAFLKLIDLHAHFNLALGDIPALRKNK